MSLSSGNEPRTSENVVVTEMLKTPLRCLESSSSPNLLARMGVAETAAILESRHVRGTSLTRSNTLPKGPRKAAAHAFIELDKSKLARFREWMVCILIGKPPIYGK